MQCQNFLRVWHLIIFRADQSKNTLYVNEIYKYVHKVVLSACSSYFKNLLKGTFDFTVA